MDDDVVNKDLSTLSVNFSKIISKATKKFLQLFSSYNVYKHTRTNRVKLLRAFFVCKFLL